MSKVFNQTSQFITDTIGVSPYASVNDSTSLNGNNDTSYVTITTNLTGLNNDLVFTAQQAGTAPTITYANPLTNNATLSVTVAGSDITVHLADDGTGVAASTVLTSDQTEPADAATVTINDVTYRFKNSPALANDIKRTGTSADTDLDNLIKAINQTGLGDGTDYFAGTVAPTGVTAAARVGHATTLTATAVGVAGNSFASTTAGTAHLTFTGSVFAGGVDPAISSTAALIASKINGSPTASALVYATNKTGNDGTGVVTALSQLKPNGIKTASGAVLAADEGVQGNISNSGDKNENHRVQIFYTDWNGISQNDALKNSSTDL